MGLESQLSPSSYIPTTRLHQHQHQLHPRNPHPHSARHPHPTRNITSGSNASIRSITSSTTNLLRSTSSLTANKLRSLFRSGRVKALVDIPKSPPFESHPLKP